MSGGVATVTDAVHHAAHGWLIFNWKQRPANLYARFDAGLTLWQHQLCTVMWCRHPTAVEGQTQLCWTPLNTLQYHFMEKDDTDKQPSMWLWRYGHMGTKVSAADAPCRRGSGPASDRQLPRHPTTLMLDSLCSGTTQQVGTEEQRQKHGQKTRKTLHR